MILIASDSTVDLGHFSKENGGNAGSITIQGPPSGSPAAHVTLDNSVISTTIDGGTSLSAPADINITAQAVTLSGNNGAITASTTGNAPAGNITVTGAGSTPLTIAGGSIQAQAGGDGSVSGNILLQAPGDLTLLGTTVSVKNTGTGDAGPINLRAGNDLLVRNSQVSTESAEGAGGDITLTAPHIIRLVDSKLSSSVQADSKGGNIDIDPQFVVIQNSQLLANANAGAGGNITIAATGAVLIDPNSRIDASAGPAGISGSVNINSPDSGPWWHLRAA